MNNVIEEMKDQAYGHLTKKDSAFWENLKMMRNGFMVIWIMI